MRGQVVCISCHFVHAADADRSLLRGFPGSDEPDRFDTWQDLCRECHGEASRSAPRTPGTTAPAPSATDPAPARKAGDGHPGREQALRVLPRPQGRSPLRRGQPLQRAAGLHGVPRPAPGQGPPRAAQGRLFRPDPRRGHAQPPPQAHALLRLPRRREPGPLRGAEAIARCQRCHGSGKIPGMSHPMPKFPAGYTIPPGWPLADGALTCLTCHFPATLRRRGRPPRRAGGHAAPAARRAVAGRPHRGLFPLPRQEPVDRPEPPPGCRSEENRVHPVSCRRILRRGTPRVSSRTSTSSVWPATTAPTIPPGFATP